jgi:hypothetical protein
MIQILLHRTDGTNSILAYEATYAPSVDIYHELQPAITELKTEYHIDPKIPIEEVQMATDTIVDLNGDGTAYDSKKNDQDLLIGSNADNVIHGNQGNDVIVGLGGNDTLYGDAGNDTIYGGTGKDTIDGGTGDDHIYLDPKAAGDTIDGGAGNNTLDFSQDTSALALDIGSGKDGTNTFTNIQSFVGTKFNDMITLGDKNVSVEGGGGEDIYKLTRKPKLDGSQTNLFDTITSVSGAFSVDVPAPNAFLVESHQNNVWDFGLYDVFNGIIKVFYLPKTHEAFIFSIVHQTSIHIENIGGNFTVSGALSNPGGQKVDPKNRFILMINYTPIPQSKTVGSGSDYAQGQDGNGIGGHANIALAQLHLFNQYMAAGFHGSDAGALSRDVEAVQIDHLATLAAAHTHMHTNFA